MRPQFHPLALSQSLFQAAHRLRPTAWFWARAAALLIVAGVAAVLWAAPVRGQAQPVHDFDQWCKWRRGAQTWGSLTQSKEQVHQGAFAGALAYDFPEGETDNFVVFQCAKPLAGKPEYLSVWVYGDGAGNLLNGWVQDATGLRWQFAFGPVAFTGWQQMTAHVAPGQAWPNGPLDGADADTVAYPIRFDGFALDNPVSDAAEGVIYLDDLRASSQADSESGSASGAAAAGKQAVQPQPTPTTEPEPASDSETASGSDAASSDGAAGSGAGAEPLQDPEVDFEVDPSSIEAGQCATLRWTVRHVRQYFVDGEGKAGDTGKEEVCPEATTTYTLRVKTLADDEEDYTVEVEVTGEGTGEVTGEVTGMAPGEAAGESQDQVTVDDAEVLEEPLDLKGLNDKPGIEAVAIADCAEARKLKCADMDQYQSNPSFGKSTKACLVWVEQGAPFGSIDIAVRRSSPNPQTELWTGSRSSLGNFACIGVPVKIGKQGSYAAVLTARGVNKTVEWRIK